MAVSCCRASVLLVMVALAGLGGCARLAYLSGSRTQLEGWASAHGWQVQAARQADFDLLVLLRQRLPASSLTVYIEGDGAPWPSAFRPPRDPTPLQPLALLLAERDPAAAVAYLGRPCQYLQAQALAGCDSHYWTDRRFAPEVLAALNLALMRLKQQTGAAQLRLVGYSGGGVLATLLAQQRPDVTGLITVAAPLALDEWARLQGLSALHGSLDPLVAVGELPPAVHFVGSQDRQVPPAVVAHFVSRRGGHLAQLPGFDHTCCWLQAWPGLLTRAATEELAP